MTKQQAVSIGDLAWKILIPLLLAVSSFSLNNMVSEIKDLRGEIQTLRGEIKTLFIDVAAVKTRLDYHEKVTQ